MTDKGPVKVADEEIKQPKSFKEKLKDIPKRIREYGFWVSLIALVPLVCQTLGMELMPEQLEQFETLINSFLAFLVALGIVSKPKNKDSGNNDGNSDESQT